MPMNPQDLLNLGVAGNPMEAFLTAQGVPPDMAATMAQVASARQPAGKDDEDDKAPDGTPSDAARAAAVKRDIAKIKAAKKFFDKQFKQMRKNQEYARFGCNKKFWDPEELYTANLMQRQINVSVAGLYARNPRAQAKRKPRLEYQVWDGDPVSLQNAAKQLAMAQQQAAIAAQQAAQAGLPPPPPVQPDPQAMAIVQEVMQVRQQHIMLDRVGKTLETCFNYFVNEQDPNFKMQMKDMVRRAKTNSVAYVELDFQRMFEPRMTGASEIADTTNQLAVVGRLQEEQADDELEDDSADKFDLETVTKVIQEQEPIIAREGIVFNFLKSTSVIVDPKCRDLKTFIGAEWIAVETPMTSEQVQEVFKIELTATNYDSYKPVGDRSEAALVGDETWQGEGDESTGKDKANRLACVWRLFNRKNGTVCVLIDGYKDYAQTPDEPVVKLSRFYPVFSLTFNDVEDEDNIYPPSDIELMKHPQDDYNRARQGLREHRRANRPKYATVAGRLEDSDKQKLMDHEANAVLELNALNQGEKVEDLLQPIKTVPIDPQAYDVGPQFQDIERTVGSQAANLGGTSNTTATESSIAESTRTSVVGSDADSLDEMLSDLAKAAAECMILNLSKETAVKIAGPGAVWPEVGRQSVLENLYLEVKAGSSGRPNIAAKLANFERGMPFIIQLPGANPTPLLTEYLDLLDIDVTDAIIDGLPSIVAQNAMAQPGAANPANSPDAQGPQGANNAQKVPTQPPQNMHPAPAAPTAPGGTPPPPPPAGPRPHLVAGGAPGPGGGA